MTLPPLNAVDYFKWFTKGNKQKVGLVQALMSRPELLMLDEPTASLDPDIADKVRRTLPLATLIHSVDSRRLLDELEREAVDAAGDGDLDQPGGGRRRLWDFPLHRVVLRRECTRRARQEIRQLGRPRRAATVHDRRGPRDPQRGFHGHGRASGQL